MRFAHQGFRKSNCQKRDVLTVSRPLVRQRQTANLRFVHQPLSVHLSGRQASARRLWGGISMSCRAIRGTPQNATSCGLGVVKRQGWTLHEIWVSPNSSFATLEGSNYHIPALSIRDFLKCSQVIREQAPSALPGMHRRQNRLLASRTCEARPLSGPRHHARNPHSSRRSRSKAQSSPDTNS